jgi:hypothetical protein
LTDVYEVKYDWEPKGGMAFIIPDSAEAKFTQWAKTAEIDVKFMKSLKDLPFDSGKMLITENHYYGEVVTGLKNGKLIGIVGYQDNQKTFLDDWLKSLSG